MKIKHIIILSFTIFSLIGCISEKKQRFKAEQFYREHPEELAQNCAEKFPVMTKFIQGVTITKRDTIFQKGKVLDCPPVFDTITKQSFIPKVICPEERIIYKTEYRTDTVINENTAKVEQYRLLNDKTAKELAISQNNEMLANKKAKQRFWMLIGLLAVIVLGGFYHYKKTLLANTK
ncbi:hypothetical protein [Arcicella sp. BE51]|nr:hypothetical protein [Arcicella sp. BE51]